MLHPPHGLHIHQQQSRRGFLRLVGEIAKVGRREIQIAANALVERALEATFRLSIREPYKPAEGVPTSGDQVADLVEEVAVVVPTKDQ